MNISFKQSHIHLWGWHGGRLSQQKVDVQFLENSFLMLLSVLFSFQMLGFVFTSLNCKFLYFLTNLQHILVLVRRRPGVASLEGVHSYVWKRTVIGDIVKKDVQFHRFKKQWNDDEWNIFAGAHVVREAVWVAWVEEGARIWEAGWVWDCAMGGG